MKNHQMTARPTMRWVQVRDTRGRTRLEMRWDVPVPAPQVGTTHAA